MRKLSRKSIKEILGFRRLLPSRISVNVARAKDGQFVARVKVSRHLIVTEGTTFSQLIEMVNDAVRTYFEIPNAYVPYMPSYVPPIQVAEQLSVFPVKKVSRNITLPLTRREKISC